MLPEVLQAEQAAHALEAVEVVVEPAASGVLADGKVLREPADSGVDLLLDFDDVASVDAIAERVEADAQDADACSRHRSGRLPVAAVTTLPGVAEAATARLSVTLFAARHLRADALLVIEGARDQQLEGLGRDLEPQRLARTQAERGVLHVGQVRPRALCSPAATVLMLFGIAPRASELPREQAVEDLLRALRVLRVLELRQQHELTARAVGLARERALEVLEGASNRRMLALDSRLEQGVRRQRGLAVAVAVRVATPAAVALLARQQVIGAAIDRCVDRRLHLAQLGFDARRIRRQRRLGRTLRPLRERGVGRHTGQHAREEAACGRWTQARIRHRGHPNRLCSESR